jgi:hypothetical protein
MLLEIADRWLLRGFDPRTLAPTGDLTLPTPAGRVAFAPGGEEAYALAAAGARLLRLDLTTGSVTSLSDAPRGAISLAVTYDRVYVPNPFGSDVWALDRHTCPGRRRDRGFPRWGGRGPGGHWGRTGRGAGLAGAEGESAMAYRVNRGDRAAFDDRRAGGDAAELAVFAAGLVVTGGLAAVAIGRLLALILGAG